MIDSKLVQSSAEELLNDLQVDAAVKVATEEDVFLVTISPKDANDSPLLIGYHGETLSSFQLILGLILFKKSTEWVKLSVDIDGYKEKREAQLKTMAESFALQAVSSGQPVYLPPLSAADRRIVHMSLQDRQDVFSESEGEGENRRLVIKPKI